MGAEAPAARLKFDIGILLPFGNLMDFSLWDFYVRISLAWHSSTIAAKSGLAFCPSVLHFSFTFVFVSNSVFVWRLFRLGSALVILFPFRLFEKGQLRYDSIWDELQLLSCMTYRLSIPTPLEGGIESHHHCGSILLQRLDSNFTHHHRTNFDNENGN